MKTAASQAIKDVIAERDRQINEEGWNTCHDDKYKNGQLCLAAASYASFAGALNEHREKNKNTTPDIWPWHNIWWKPSTPRRDLIKSAAMILAEIERIDRANQRG